MDDLVIEHDSAVPPYEQLRAQLAACHPAGELPPGTRLATVRETAQRLGLAVNTVARAYRELEADGVVVTEGRRGTFVRSAVVDGTADGAAGADVADVAERARRAAADYVRAARRAGLSRAEALRLVDAAWR
jgi:DNA-binding transcriptional regulator YhcF (GntR family)